MPPFRDSAASDKTAPGCQAQALSLAARSSKAATTFWVFPSWCLLNFQNDPLIPIGGRDWFYRPIFPSVWSLAKFLSGGSPKHSLLQEQVESHMEVRNPKRRPAVGPLDAAQFVSNADNGRGQASLQP